MKRYSKLLFLIGSILILFSLSSLAFLLIQIHHDDDSSSNQNKALLSQNSKKSIKPPITTTQSSFSVSETLHDTLSAIPPEKCTNKPSLTSDDECIDSKGSICSCSSGLNKNGCCFSSSGRTMVNSSSTKFSFSSYAECVSTCLLPVHDERRIQNFIKLQYTKRYRGLVRKIVNRFLKKKNRRSTSSNLEVHRKENTNVLLPEKIFLSKDDVKMLLVRPSGDADKENTTNNHFGLWFCGEQCRFDRESIYYETRFKKEGPVFQF